MTRSTADTDTLQNTKQNMGKRNFLIEIFGLGYVGFPLAVKLANAGLTVRGIDINPERIKRLEKNELLDSETHLRDQFLLCRKNGNLQLSDKPLKSHDELAGHVHNSRLTTVNSEYNKVGIICVHTPVPDNSTTSDSYVKSAAESFLSSAKRGDIMIIESSIEVGTTDNIQSIIESKNYTVGEDFGLCFCPERIDPQNKKWNLENIPRIVYCSDDATYDIVKKIYYHVNGANILRVSSSRTAEVVKSYENAFRLVNISLVNELAILCDKLGIRVKEVIDAAATKPFGFLPFYPGAGAGGHCIPKDPLFLVQSAKNFGTRFETIENALNINQKVPKYICDRIEQKIEQKNLQKSILVAGLTYKPDVEDMRDSPGFKILKELNNRSGGFQIYTYDPFFKEELLDKYLIENYLSRLEFTPLKQIDSDSELSKISCLCIAQHHTKSKFRLSDIYHKGVVPIIYDCQSKLEHNPQSKTELVYLGA